MTSIDYLCDSHIIGVFTLEDVARFNPYLSASLENNGRGPVTMCSAWIRSWETVWTKIGQARVYAFSHAYDTQIALRAASKTDAIPSSRISTTDPVSTSK